MRREPQAGSQAARSNPPQPGRSRRSGRAQCWIFQSFRAGVRPRFLVEGWRRDYRATPDGKAGRNCEVPTVQLFAPPADQDDPTAPATGIDAFQFPEWFITQDVESSDSKSTARSRMLVHRKALTKGKFIDDNKKRRSVVPVRFVRACRAGHIGDIDWYSFVHGGPNECRRQLWIDERGTSGDLSEVWIRCECKAERNMAQAAILQARALGNCDHTALARSIHKGIMRRTQPLAHPDREQRLLSPNDDGHFVAGAQRDRQASDRRRPGNSLRPSKTLSSLNTNVKRPRSKPLWRVFRNEEAFAGIQSSPERPHEGRKKGEGRRT